jgi:hypothetical protein
VGKTTLTVRVAHRMAARYPDAQLFLPFPGDGPGAVAEALDRLLRMLGVPAARIPAGTGERARLWRAEMAHRRAVIVLDDVLAPDQVTPIVLAAGDSLTLITSRQHTDWPGQCVLRLEPLGAGESATLLQRAAGPAVVQDAEKMTTVASLCGGWPLAIRVAGSRLRASDGDLDQLINELEDVHTGRSESGDIARRIFSAFEVTYRQLTVRDKRIFRILVRQSPIASWPGRSCVRGVRVGGTSGIGPGGGVAIQASGRRGRVAGVG